MVTFNSDIDVLNYALTLEQFEAALYKVLVGANLLSGTEQQYLVTFGQQEQAHVDTLTQVIGQLGGKPVTAPASYNFAAAGPITNRAQLLAVIQTVEDLGASAYLGAAGFIKSPDLLTAAVTIHAVEAEHAAVFRDLLGMPAAPDAVAKGTAPDDVIKAVTPFLMAAAPATAPAAPAAPPASAPVAPPTAPSTGAGGGAGYIRRLGDG
jgi:hypothetical protein